MEKQRRENLGKLCEHLPEHLLYYEIHKQERQAPLIKAGTVHTLHMQYY